MSRILLWTQAEIPSLGGVQTHLSHLISGLHRAGHSVLLIASGLGQTEWAQIPVYRFCFDETLKSRRPDLILQVIGQLKQVVLDFRPHLVHLHSLSSSNFFFLKAIRLSNTPKLLTCHGDAFATMSPKGLQGAVLRSMDTVLCCSAYVLKQLNSWLPLESQVRRVLYAGLPSQPNIPLTSRRRFLILGKLAPRKGIDLALEAFKKVQKEFPDARLDIGGEGAWREALENQAGPGVSFLGPVEPSKVYSEIFDSLAVIVPSRREPLGLSPAEAGACGRPVVGFKVGGVPEVVEHKVTGLLAPAEDTATLADQMLILLRDFSLAQRLGRAARMRIEQKFHMNSFLKSSIQLYSELTSAP